MSESPQTPTLDEPMLSALLGEWADEFEYRARNYRELAKATKRHDVKRIREANAEFNEKRAAGCRALASLLPSLIEDAARLDAISEIGAKTRVYMMATENMANPPRIRRASVTLPHGVQADYVSDRSTLREAIDGARFGRGDAARDSKGKAND